MLKGSAYIMILGAMGLALFAAAISGAWEGFPPAAYEAAMEPVRPGQEDSVRRIVFADQRLWLLSDAGEVWVVREGQEGGQKAQTPDAVFDICVQNGAPIIATASRDRPTIWRLRRWQDGRWADAAAVPVEDDGLVAMACEPDRVVVLTSRRIIDLGATRRVTTLSNRAPVRPVSVVLATPDYLYVGLNAGEWGGGLKRIDRATGAVQTLARNESGDLCGGPLSGCDPVNGLAASPWKPDCIVAAVGLIHMTGVGRLVEVCGDRIKSLYSEPCPGARGSGDCTTPFFGIAPVGRTLLAVAPDELVTLDGSGRSTRETGLHFQTYGPFQVSFAPSFVVVRTSANRRHSLSGVTPLITAR